MQELGRHISDQTQIIFGAAVDGRLGDCLSVTIISSLSAEEEAMLPEAPPAPSSASAPSPVREHYEPQPPEPEIQEEQPGIEPAPVEEMIPFEEPSAAELEPTPFIPDESPAPPTRNGEPERTRIKSHNKPIASKEEKVSTEKSVTPAKQEVLQFEPVTRGRFEKSEPTIIEGEDLDVPTYLRKNIRIK
jgi:cell division protein FtsZ